MAIQPSTEIRVLAGVPLDPTYRNTVAFSSQSEQANYFSSKAIYTMEQSTYQRVEKGEIMCKAKADELYSANYVMFKNTGYGSKWFYAFVNSIEYVNNLTTRLTYQIDYMQTYLFDWESRQTLVERETPSTDTYRDNILAEPFNAPYNGYIMQDITPNLGSEFLTDSFVYCIANSVNGEGQTAEPKLYGGAPNCVEVWGYADFNAYAEQIKSMNDIDIGRIVFTCAVPKTLHDALGGVVGWKNTPATIDKFVVFNLEDVRNNYTSTRWSKCRIYPYQSLVCVLGNQVVEFAPDGFTGDARFQLTYTFSGNPSLVVHPLNYIDKTIYLESTFPEIPYIGDFYRQYASALASNKASTVFNSLQGHSGNTLLGISQTVLDYEQKNIQIEEQYLQHPPTVSNYSADYSAFLTDRLLPKFYVKRLKSDYAHALDDFLTTNGYNIRKLKAFSKGSGKFHYIKTSHCDILSNKVPAKYVEAICRLHDNGITYWDSPSNVGNY